MAYSYQDVMTALRAADAAGNTEDATRLATIANSMQPIATTAEKPKEEAGVIRRVLGDPAVSLAQGVVGLPEVVTGIADIPTMGYAGKAVESLEKSIFGGTTKDVRENLQELKSEAQKAEEAKVSETFAKEGVGAGLKQAITHPGVIAGTVTESIPAMLGGAGIARGVAGTVAKYVSKTATPIVAAGIGEGAVTSGQIAEQLRQGSEEGLLTPKQAALSTIAGALTAGLGVVGGKAAEKLGIADYDVLLAGGVSTAKKQAVLTGALKSAISESAFEELPQSLQEQAMQNLAENKKWDDGLAEAGAMGAIAGFVMGGFGGAYSQVKSNRALARKEETDKLMGALNEEFKKVPGQDTTTKTEPPVTTEPTVTLSQLQTHATSRLKELEEKANGVPAQETVDETGQPFTIPAKPAQPMTPQEVAELQFLQQHISNPEMLSKGYGVTLTERKVTGSHDTQAAIDELEGKAMPISPIYKPVETAEPAKPAEPEPPPTEDNKEPPAPQQAGTYEGSSGALHQNFTITDMEKDKPAEEPKIESISKDKPLYGKHTLDEIDSMLSKLFYSNTNKPIQTAGWQVFDDQNKTLPKTKLGNQVSVTYRPDTIAGRSVEGKYYQGDFFAPNAIQSFTIHNPNSKTGFTEAAREVLNEHFERSRDLSTGAITYTLKQRETPESLAAKNDALVKQYQDFLNSKKRPIKVSYKVTSRPGLNAFQQMMEKHDTLGSALRDIYDRLERNDVENLTFVTSQQRRAVQDLIEKLLKIEAVDKTQLHMIGTTISDRGSGVNGYYSGTYNYIAIFASANSKTLIHEAIHAATMHYIGNHPDSQLVKNLDKLLRASRKATPIDPKTGKKKYWYGNTDTDEFIAEAFSNPDFMDHLSKIPSVLTDAPTSNVWDNFKQLIRSMLGVPEGFKSVFDDIMDTSSEAFTGMTLEDYKISQRGKRKVTKEVAQASGWTPKRIQDIWNTYRYMQNGREKDTKAYATMISPDQFLGLTMSDSHFESLLKDNEIRNKITPLDLERLKKYDMPMFLDVTENKDGTWQVTGHEGRHRMVALYRAGVKQVPIVIRTKDVKARDIVNNARFLPQKFDKETGVSETTVGELIPLNYDNKSNIINMIEEPSIRFSHEESEHEEGSRQIFNYRGDPIDIRKWQIPSMSKIAEKLDHVFWAWADEHSTLTKVQNAIKALGRSISDMSNMARKMELLHSKITDRLEHFVMDEVNPIIKKMISFKVSLDDIKQYLHARHAEEYNNRMNELNHRVDEDGNIIPYALKDRASSMTTEDARNYLTSLDPVREQQLKEIADMFYAIRDKTQQILVDSGQETQETIDLWNELYPDYVPLNREQEQQAVPAGLRTGVGVDTRGNFAKRAMGSEKAIINPIDALLYQRERAIARAENNEVSKSVFRLALENPQPDFWMAINPDAIHSREKLIQELEDMGYANAEEIADNIMAEPKERYLRKVKPSDFVIDPNTGLPIPNTKEVVDARVSRNARFGDNVLSLKINGRERYVFFNQKDPLAIRMVRSLKNLEAEKLGPMTSMMRRVTHYFGQINTVIDPVFSMVNGLKDYPFAMANLSTTKLKGKQLEVSKNIFPAMMGIISTLRKQKAGNNTANSEWQKIYQEAKAAGFQTANRYAVLKSGEDKAYIEQTMNKFTDRNDKKAFRYIIDALYDFGSMVENGVRLSAYKVARDNNMSPEEAASIAKNLTVNFDKKGARTGTIRALFLFFNASVRSTVRLAETLNGPTGKAIIGGGVLLGVMQAMLLAGAGYKEDDPPEYIKEHNLVLPTSDGHYVTIPLAYGLNVLPNIGRVFTEYGQDVNRHGWHKAQAMKRALNLSNSFFSSFSPFGNQGLTPLAIVPSAAEPLVGLAVNKNAFGQTISRQDSYTRPTPGYTRTKETGSTAGKEVARLMNLAMGGTDYAKSKIWSPTGDDIDFLVGSVTGGPGREVSKIGEFAKNQVTGEVTPAYRVPIVGRFYGETDTKPVISSRFYNNINQMYEHENTIKNLRKDPVAKRQYLEDNPDARMWHAAEAYEAQINNLNATKKKLEALGRPKEQIDRIDNKKIILMNRFNDRVEKAKTQ